MKRERKKPKKLLYNNFSIIFFNVNANYSVGVLNYFFVYYIFSGLTVSTMFSGARGNETNEVLNERKKKKRRSL